MHQKRILVTVLSTAIASAVAAPMVQAQAPVGTYTLVQVNGRALPIVAERNPECVDEIHDATLNILEGSVWRMTFTEVETCGSEVDEDLDDAEGGYVVRDGTIVFSEEDESDDEPGEIDIDELGVGVLTADGIEITLQDRRSRLVFRRE